MKNPGRLPSVDCTTPVAAGPSRSEMPSVPTPISHAAPPSASPVTTNVSTSFAPP
jgi:hypothetical protein